MRTCVSKCDSHQNKFKNFRCIRARTTPTTMLVLLFFSRSLVAISKKSYISLWCVEFIHENDDGKASCMCWLVNNLKTKFMSKCPNGDSLLRDQKKCFTWRTHTLFFYQKGKHKLIFQGVGFWVRRDGRERGHCVMKEGLDLLWIYFMGDLRLGWVRRTKNMFVGFFLMKIVSFRKKLKNIFRKVVFCFALKMKMSNELRFDLKLIFDVEYKLNLFLFLRN